MIQIHTRGGGGRETRETRDDHARAHDGGPTIAAWHVRHMVFPGSGWYVPDGHGLQLRCWFFSAEYMPAAQSLQVALPVASVYLPAGHALHPVGAENSLPSLAQSANGSPSL